jgi:hypothetical protein
LNRAKEALRVLNESDQGPQRQRVVEHAPAAIPDEERRGQRRDDLDRRIEHGVVED